MAKIDSGRLRLLAPGILLALLAIAYGFFLGGAFMVAKDRINLRLQKRAEAVYDTVYQGDEGAMKKIISDSWTFYKLAHTHSIGLGTVAIVLILAIGLCGPVDRLGQLSAIALGAGTLIYGVCWMFLALKVPGMGNSDAAKESLAWLAFPSFILTMLGLVGTFIIFIRTMLGVSRHKTKNT